MKLTVHRYKLKGDNPGEYIHPYTESNDIPLAPDGDVTLMPEWGDRAPSPSTWHDEDFDLKYFIVFDEEFGQPYVPFYRVLEGNETDSDYVATVVSNYNKALDACPWLERIS